MRLGVLDIGSNTVHLLVVDAYYGAAPVPAHSAKIDLRLAEQVAGGRVQQDAVGELVEFGRRAVRLAEDLGVTHIEAFATSALREATNGADVLDRLARDSGIHTKLLTGADEARLTYLAARRWFGWSAGRMLLLDIGGGSLEIAVGTDEEPESVVSLPLGAGRVTRERLPGDPPDPDQVREVRRQVRTEIASRIARVNRGGRDFQRVVASSKTFKQLARIAGAAPSTEGPFVRRTLRRADLTKWLPRLTEMTSTQRAELPGVSVRRAGQLVAGALVAEAAMELFGVDEVDISPWALREGVILRRLDHLDGTEEPPA